MRSSLRIAAAVLALATTTPAWAGSPYRSDAAGPPADARLDPAANGVPDVPNLQGCIPWCQRDMNPCDPPIYKRVDGRCNYFN